MGGAELISSGINSEVSKKTCLNTPRNVPLSAITVAPKQDICEHPDMAFFIRSQLEHIMSPLVAIESWCDPIIPAVAMPLVQTVAKTRAATSNKEINRRAEFTTIP